MKEYIAEYTDKQGEKQTSYVTAPDVRTAINNLLELRPDCARVTSCRPKPMWTEDNDT